MEKEKVICQSQHMLAMRVPGRLGGNEWVRWGDGEFDMEVFYEPDIMMATLFVPDSHDFDYVLNGLDYNRKQVKIVKVQEVVTRIFTEKEMGKSK